MVLFSHIMAEHLSFSQKGVLLSVLYVSSAAFQIPIGALADKFGARKLMLIGISCQSLFICLIDMIYRLPFELIVTVYTLLGVSIGCFLTPSWKMIATYFPIHKRGRATSINLSANTLVLAFIASIYTLIYKVDAFNHSWLVLFIILGILGFLVAIGIYFYCLDTPCHHHPTTQANLTGLPPKRLPFNIGKNSRISIFINQSFLWKMVLFWFLFSIAFSGISTWLPNYFIIKHGPIILNTGIMPVIPLLFGTLGTLIAGYFADQFNPLSNKLLISGTILTAIIFYMNSLVSDSYLMFFYQPIPVVVIYQSILALLMYFSITIFWSILIKQISVNFMGLATGMVNFGGQIAGIISVPIMAFMIDQNQGNYDNTFILIAITLVVSAVIAMTVKSIRQ